MGGRDWELWMNALEEAGVLADNAQSVAYSYIGTDLTWPIYWHGTLGKSKEDLDRAAAAINQKTAGQRRRGVCCRSEICRDSGLFRYSCYAVYISIVFKIMKEKGIHEGCIEQTQRLFATKLFNGSAPETDENSVCAWMTGNYAMMCRTPAVKSGSS